LLFRLVAVFSGEFNVGILRQGFWLCLRENWKWWRLKFQNGRRVKSTQFENQTLYILKAFLRMMMCVWIYVGARVGNFEIGFIFGTTCTYKMASRLVASLKFGSFLDFCSVQIFLKLRLGILILSYFSYLFKFPILAPFLDNLNIKMLSIMIIDWKCYSEVK